MKRKKSKKKTYIKNDIWGIIRKTAQNLITEESHLLQRKRLSRHTADRFSKMIKSQWKTVDFKAIKKAVYSAFQWLKMQLIINENFDPEKTNTQNRETVKTIFFNKTKMRLPNTKVHKLIQLRRVQLALC